MRRVDKLEALAIFFVHSVCHGADLSPEKSAQLQSVRMQIQQLQSELSLNGQTLRNPGLSAAHHASLDARGRQLEQALAARRTEERAITASATK